MGSFLIENSNIKNLLPDDKQRTVFIDDLGVQSTDFDLSKTKIDELVESGRKAMHDFYNKKPDDSPSS